MFKLIRLAIYALVGYAAYQFVMDVVNAEPQQAGGPARDQSGRFASQRRRGGGNQGGGGSRSPGGTRMTAANRGGGGGRAETTQNPDGGAVSHRVGRGVV
jgi:hypothetical protein